MAKAKTTNFQIQTREHQHGFRSIIEDKEAKQKWNGNIADTMDQAKNNAIDGFIQEKLNQINIREKEINDLQHSIDKLSEFKK